MRILLHRCWMVIGAAALMGGAGPLNAGDGHRDDDREQAPIMVVLHQGRLSHDANWVITHGPKGPDNQKPNGLGGTCSMVPSDVLNGFATEKITFEADRKDLGVWQMAWTDSVSGQTADGNRYTYLRRLGFAGVTTDGRMPRPNMARPTASNEGFLQAVPDNVNTAALEMNDWFLLYSPAGNLIAHSHVHVTFRHQIPPEGSDPPPAFYPVILSKHFILGTVDVLAGQIGCDPL